MLQNRGCSEKDHVAVCINSGLMPKGIGPAFIQQRFIILLNLCCRIVPKLGPDGTFFRKMTKNIETNADQARLSM